MQAINDLSGTAIAPENPAPHGVSGLVDVPCPITRRGDPDPGNLCFEFLQAHSNFAQAVFCFLPELVHVLLNPQRFRTPQRHGGFARLNFLSQRVEGHCLHHGRSRINTNQA